MHIRSVSRFVKCWGREMHPDLVKCSLVGEADLTTMILKIPPPPILMIFEQSFHLFIADCKVTYILGCITSLSAESGSFPTCDRSCNMVIKAVVNEDYLPVTLSLLIRINSLIITRKTRWYHCVNDRGLKCRLSVHTTKILKVDINYLWGKNIFI